MPAAAILIAVYNKKATLGHHKKELKHARKRELVKLVVDCLRSKHHQQHGDIV